MMREYVEVIKSIKPEIFDEPAAKLHKANKKRKEAALKPVKTITPGTEKKPEQRPVGMIPVYVAGLALILIIVCYFYYQGGKKETKTLYFAQKEQTKIKTYPVYRDSVPSDDTGDQQGIFPQPSEITTSSLPIQQDSLIKESKELVDKEPFKGQAETFILLSKEALSVAVEKAPSLSKELTHVIIGSEDAVLSAEQKDLKAFKEKAPVKESEPVSKRKETKLKEKTPVAKVEQKQQPLTLPHVEKRKSNTVQVKTQPDSYNVSLHYTSEKNKELIEYLAILLQLEGFGVFGQDPHGN